MAMMAPRFTHAINLIALLEYTLNILEFHLMLLNVLETDFAKKGSLFLPYLAFWSTLRL